MCADVELEFKPRASLFAGNKIVIKSVFFRKEIWKLLVPSGFLFLASPLPHQKNHPPASSIHFVRVILLLEDDSARGTSTPKI
jgi:hypothetical protein